MKDAGLSNSPSARRFEVTDAQLSAELKNWTGTSPALHPVGELLDRHWEAAFAYARLCSDGERAAGMLTTAAFTRLFGETLRQNGPTSAWRPHLLLTVRRIAAEWDSDGRRDLLHPDLRAAGSEGERPAARLLPPVHRRLLSRAFQRLSPSARCLLWHTEIEAEPLAVPAGLLGLDEEGARVELRRARDRLREECLQVHRELAVDEDCHRYHRLLDVTCRRGGIDVDPDLRTHLGHCRHCAHTADQLNQFGAGLGIALAEGVLGWCAAAYLRARTEPSADAPVAAPPVRRLASVGEAFTDETAVAPPLGATGTGEPAAVPAPGTEPHDGSPSTGDSGQDPRPGTRRSANKAARRVRRRNLAVAVLTVSGLVVLPLVLWSAVSGGDSASSGSSGDDTAAPAPDRDASTTDPSWVGAGEETQGTLRGRLHNVASGLCIGVVGTKAVKDAEVELAACSSDAGQQWSYEADGLLRNTEDPDLCLDSRLGYSIRLAACAGASQPGARNVRYDFTLQGTLVPRSDQNLALAPAATDGSGALVLKNRTDSSAQRWVIDTSQPDPQMQVVNWGADSNLAETRTSTPPSAPEAPKSPAPSSAPEPAPTPTTAAPSPTPTPAPTPCGYPYAYSCSGDTPDYGYGNGGYGYGGYGYGYGGPGSGGRR
ncbi:ricin-type beta-trefoil lectin domain protein [Streptomyces phaeoluteigriseus]|uniref:Ricin-type beta-trefoil lectin domain protein n=1 Tax=Streptomyces phaeoluteigriseus TaxID=114686 RepID=A0ABY4Z8K7_9ACTN|nr:ricin-type beta-trefoil lectin domain protein [Streptomyces phaeoluteigriseus]USQ84860.1 ricin-type beta-trefoil lectin domain protein [Streptomyces phaeoluteigriseus]